MASCGRMARETRHCRLKLHNWWMVGNPSLTGLWTSCPSSMSLMGGRSEQLLMPIQSNSCPEITVYDPTPIRCRIASRASETLVRTPCSSRYLRNCSFMPPAVA
jgi:hypothetical protein